MRTRQSWLEWKSRIADNVIIGVTMGITVILVVILASIALGNQQQNTLNAIRDVGRAQACVTALAIGPNGRDEGTVNGLCFIPNGVEPIDTNYDGHVNIVPSQNGGL